LIAVKKAGCTRCGATATTVIMEEAIERFGKSEGSYSVKWNDIYIKVD
jgi:hypothetical protein